VVCGDLPPNTADGRLPSSKSPRRRRISKCWTRPITWGTSTTFMLTNARPKPVAAMSPWSRSMPVVTSEGWHVAGFRLFGAQLFLWVRVRRVGDPVAPAESSVWCTNTHVRMGVGCEPETSARGALARVCVLGRKIKPEFAKGESQADHFVVCDSTRSCSIIGWAIIVVAAVAAAAACSCV
jgi:hypothetical protein